MKNIVYSCSGCSSAAQTANAIALRLDRLGLAKMSCIAGVGGGVKPLVRQAQKAENIIAIDGCPLSCCKACLANQDLKANVHIDLSKEGVKKQFGTDFVPEDCNRLTEKIISAIN